VDELEDLQERVFALYAAQPPDQERASVSPSFLGLYERKKMSQHPPDSRANQSR
jgi:hypothetical protein